MFPMNSIILLMSAMDGSRFNIRDTFFFEEISLILRLFSCFFIYFSVVLRLAYQIFCHLAISMASILPAQGVLSSWWLVLSDGFVCCQDQNCLHLLHGAQSLKWIVKELLNAVLLVSQSLHLWDNVFNNMQVKKMKIKNHVVQQLPVLCRNFRLMVLPSLRLEGRWDGKQWSRPSIFGCGCGRSSRWNNTDVCFWFSCHRQIPENRETNLNGCFILVAADFFPLRADIMVGVYPQAEAAN